jgi:hypothetical protein
MRAGAGLGCVHCGRPTNRHLPPSGGRGGGGNLAGPPPLRVNASCGWAAAARRLPTQSPHNESAAACVVCCALVAAQFQAAAARFLPPAVEGGPTMVVSPTMRPLDEGLGFAVWGPGRCSQSPCHLCNEWTCVGNGRMARGLLPAPPGGSALVGECAFFRCRQGLSADQQLPRTCTGTSSCECCGHCSFAPDPLVR